jgi:hypothetical protein
MTVQKNASATTTAGIFCDWGSKVRIVQAKVKGFGLGGVYGAGADVTIDSSSLQDNISIGSGGGVSLHWYSDTYPGTLLMRQCSVTGNSGYDGGGIYYSGDGLANLYNVTIANNSAYGGKGGGVMVETHNSGYFDLHGCTITGNSAAISGGGVSENAAATPPKAIQCLIAKNTAPTAKDVDGWLASSNTLVGDNSGNTATPPEPTMRTPVANPGLGSLTETGWPLNIKMVPLLSTSPSTDWTYADAGDQMTGVDGRGRERLVDGNQNGIKTGDHGAYEFDPLFKETDTLGVTSNITHNSYPDPECAGNKCTHMMGTGTSSYVIYNARVHQTGTYNLKVRMKKNDNRAVFQLSYGSQGGALTNVGGPQDMYAATQSFTELNFGNVAFNSTGVKSFKFQVTDKNPLSGGYQLYFDYIKLTGP